ALRRLLLAVLLLLLQKRLPRFALDVRLSRPPDAALSARERLQPAATRDHARFGAAESYAQEREQVHENDDRRAAGTTHAFDSTPPRTGSGRTCSSPRRQRSWTTNSALGSGKSVRAWQPRVSRRHAAERATSAPVRSMFCVSQPNGSSKILSSVYLA